MAIRQGGENEFMPAFQKDEEEKKAGKDVKKAKTGGGWWFGTTAEKKPSGESDKDAVREQVFANAKEQLNEALEIGATVTSYAH